MYFTMLKIVSGCTMGEKKYIVLQRGIYCVYFGKKKNLQKWNLAASDI